MILKASQRGGGAGPGRASDAHDENEHVRAARAARLRRRRSERRVQGSRGDQPRHEVPPVSVLPVAQPARSRRGSRSSDFEAAIDRIEERLGLEGQPRAIVFHEKEGRRHAHCVWSRIDAETMTARQMPFFKKKLMEISRDLYLEHGWKMPRGIDNAGERNPTNFTLAEWQQAKRQGIDPRWIKQAVQDCWAHSDNRRGLRAQPRERGFFLAQGRQAQLRRPRSYGRSSFAAPRARSEDQRGSRRRLGDGEELPAVDETQGVDRRAHDARRSAAMSKKPREQFQKRSATLGAVKEEMTREHRKARVKLDQRAEPNGTPRPANARPGCRRASRPVASASPANTRSSEAE